MISVNTPAKRRDKNWGKFLYLQLEFFACS